MLGTKRSNQILKPNSKTLYSQMFFQSRFDFNCFFRWLKQLTRQKCKCLTLPKKIKLYEIILSVIVFFSVLKMCTSTWFKKYLLQNLRKLQFHFFFAFPLISNKIGSFFRHHNNSGICISTDLSWKYGSIDNTQPFDAFNS